MDIKNVSFPDLEKYVEECNTALIDKKNPDIFYYPTEYLIGKSIDDAVWGKEETIKYIKELNIDILSTIKNKANIYAIFIFENDEWKVKYVGQRKASDINQRIKQHLVSKSDKTSSKLKEVREAVSRGQKIGLSFIKVDNEFLRTFVEQKIIYKNKDILVWNKHH